MLRRKLFLVLGSVITLLLVAGVSAILVLASVLEDLERVVSQASTSTAAITEIQLRLSSLDHETIAPTALQPLQAPLDTLRSIDSLQHNEASANALRGLGESLRELDHSSPAVVRPARDSIAAAQTALKQLDSSMHAYTESQQALATSKFRWSALMLGLAFVVIINASIMVFSRMSSMILKPVDELVQANRRLEKEDFSHRLEFSRRDEFGELAQAHNRLAAQLQANEERKVETLRQVARTLSHELNNAISIIQSQLDLLARSNGSMKNSRGIDSANNLADRSAEVFRNRLHEIQQALARMSAIVADLTRVRRIVLTDYLSGVKMLDLQRSVQDDSAENHTSGTV